MPPPRKSTRSFALRHSDAPARWEERTTNRVLETGRDQILERSRKIVQAAYELLEEQGLEGLTIRAVLKRTGLSRRAFYERFEGKDDLVLAVFEHTIRRAASYLTELARTTADPMERLKVIVTSLVFGNLTLAAPEAAQSNRRGAALSREHLRLAESRPADLQAALRPLHAVITQQLSDGMQAGCVRRDDPQRMAALVYNLVSTTVHTELLAQESARPDRANRARLAEDIWEFCRRAITA
ncbi:MAG: TetR family transcriptional regulator [Gammaproteobacteria bacterium]|nr:TetR family transcriptional regulator [Gammaproteobacteria bacterium]